MGKELKKEYHVWLSSKARERLDILSIYDGASSVEVIRRAVAFTGLMEIGECPAHFIRVGSCDHQISEKGYLLPFHNDGFDLAVFKNGIGASFDDCKKITKSGSVFRVNFSDRFVELMQKIDPNLSYCLLKSLWNYFTIRSDMARNINQSVFFLKGQEEVQVSFPPIQRRYLGR